MRVPCWGRGWRGRAGGGFQTQSWGGVSFSEVALPFSSCSCHDSAELPPGGDGGHSDVGRVPPQGTELHGVSVSNEAVLEVICMDTPARRRQGRVGELFRIRRNGRCEGRELASGESLSGVGLCFLKRESGVDVVIPEFLDQKLEFHR